MGVYSIPECNLEAFRKKVNRIEKKCNKYHNSFEYEELNEFYQDTKIDGKIIPVKYLNVKIDGIAKVNGWRLLAMIEDVPGESKNFISIINNSVPVPDHYRFEDIRCEHCNTSRKRKSAFIIYNEETKEFKEVGRSCLVDYTHGLSGELAGYLNSFIRELDEGKDFFTVSSNVSLYYNVDELLNIAFECIDKWGWSAKANDRLSTYYRACNIYRLRHNLLTDTDTLHYIKGLITEANFDENEKDRSATVAELKTLLKDYDGKYGLDSLMVNTILSNEYVKIGQVGSLVYLPIIYSKLLKDIEESQNNVSDSHSEYVRSVGQRLTIDVKSSELVASFETLYGFTSLYRFIDECDNEYIWYSSSLFLSKDAAENITTVKGTVKDHNEYKGVKQTILTRCKVQLKEVLDA